MTVDLRGIWRGKMNANRYDSFVFSSGQLPQYAGPPVNYAGEPSIWFGLKISSQFESAPKIMVISGEAGHYSGEHGEWQQITLPINGFFLDDEVHLTFLSLITRMPANFLGNLHDDSHIVGDWTEARQWNQCGSYGLGNYCDSFNFGKMSLQKMISFKDSIELATARHLFVP